MTLPANEEAAVDQKKSTNFLRRLDDLAVPAGMLALGALGQAGFAIKGGKTIVYVDPYLSDAITATGGPPRAIDIPVNPAAIANAAAVLCTHEHADHTDPETVLSITRASASAPVYASPQGRDILTRAGLASERIVMPALGEPQTIGDMRITAVPAAHYAYEVDASGHSRWMGFLVEAGGVTLYHAGDTILVPEVMAALERQHLDLALLPINGRDYFREQEDIVGNLNVREVATICSRLHPNVLIPMHNDLFATNRVSPADLVAELDRLAPRQRFHFLQPGEIYVYCG